MEIILGDFCWDDKKEAENVLKHDIDFILASKVFLDPNVRIFSDSIHSKIEERWFCLGMVNHKVMTVRFVYRDNKIRIIGAGWWRKGRRIYEEKNR